MKNVIFWRWVVMLLCATFSAIGFVIGIATRDCIVINIVGLIIATTFFGLGIFAITRDL